MVYVKVVFILRWSESVNAGANIMCTCITFSHSIYVVNSGVVLFLGDLTPGFYCTNDKAELNTYNTDIYKISAWPL